MKRLFILAVFFLHTCCVFGQLKTTRQFFSRNGFCSRTIILDSNGFFFSEEGCEERANISYGRYKISKRNKVVFNLLPLDDLTPVNKIIPGLVTEDSFITVSFYDRYNIPLYLSFGILAADTNNKVHEVWPGHDGLIRVNRFIFKSISIGQLITIYGEVSEIKIDSRSLDIYLNLPSVFLWHTQIRVDKSKRPKLILKSDGLYDRRTKVLMYSAN